MLSDNMPHLTGLSVYVCNMYVLYLWREPYSTYCTSLRPRDLRNANGTQRRLPLPWTTPSRSLLDCRPASITMYRVRGTFICVLAHEWLRDVSASTREGGGEGGGVGEREGVGWRGFSGARAQFANGLDISQAHLSTFFLFRDPARLESLPGQQVLKRIGERQRNSRARCERGMAFAPCALGVYSTPGHTQVGTYHVS